MSVEFDDLPARSPVLGTDRVLIEKEIATVDAIADYLNVAIASGFVANPTVYSADGALTAASSMWTIVGLHGMGLPADTDASVRMLYAPAGCYLAPHGYPTTGTVNGLPAGDAATLPVGVYLVIGDGSDGWTVASYAVAAIQTAGHAAVSIVGRSVNSSGDAADIAASSNDTFLQRVSNALTWAGLTIGMVADGLLTRAKLADGAAHTLVGRSANSSGAVDDISIGTDEGVFNVAGVLTSQKVKLENIDSTIAAATTGGAGLMTAAQVTSHDQMKLGHPATGYVSKAASFAFGAAEYWADVSTAAGAVTATMPDPTSFAGRGVVVRKTTSDANGITPAPFGSETFNGAAAALLPGSTSAMHLTYYFHSDGTNWTH